MLVSAAGNPFVGLDPATIALPLHGWAATLEFERCRRTRVVCGDPRDNGAHGGVQMKATSGNSMSTGSAAAGTQPSRRGGRPPTPASTPPEIVETIGWEPRVPIPLPRPSDVVDATSALQPRPKHKLVVLGDSISQGFRSLAISGEFLRVKHCNRVSGFYFSAFVYGQTLNASADFWADYHLVCVNSADQDEIRRVVGRQKIVDGGDHQQQSEKSKEAVSLAHGLQTFCAAAGVKMAAQIKSSTAALRAAIRSGDAGSPACINCCAGMLMK